MEPNMTNEPTAEPTTPVAEAPAAESNDAAPQSADEQADQQATLQTNDQEETAEDDDVDWDSIVNRNPVQNVQPNEDGFIDPLAYKEQIKAEVRDDIRFQQREARAWSKLEEKYPELKGDKEARQLILAKRVFDVQNGGNGSLATAGKAVMGRISGAKQEGKIDAQVSIKTQQNAGLSRASAPRDTSAMDTKAKLASGDPEAVHTTLKDWLDQGKI